MDRPLVGAADLQRDARRLGELLELGLDPGDGVPVSRHQHQDREIRPERRHPALADVAATIGDFLAEFVDEPDAVRADGGNR